MIWTTSSGISYQMRNINFTCRCCVLRAYIFDLFFVFTIFQIKIKNWNCLIHTCIPVPLVVIAIRTSFMTYQRVSKYKQYGASSGAGTVYTYAAPGFTLIRSCVVQSLGFCVVLCRSLLFFCSFSSGHCTTLGHFAEIYLVKYIFFELYS
jgi:hypothetical protein